MKVLIISKNLVAGAYHAKLREITKQGVELTVAASPRWRTQRIEDVKPDGYELLMARTRFSGPTLRGCANHVFYFPGVSRVIAREKWDIVHIDEEPFNFCTYHALQACRQAGLRAVFSTSQNIMKRYPPPFSQFESAVFEGASGAAAISEEARELLRRRGFSKPVAVIPHGVDPTVFCKQDADPLRHALGLDGRFVVGYVGRISPEKGLDTLVNALDLLPKNSVLLLVGNGAERPRLQAMIKELDLSERVRWVPWASSKEVPGYMNALDVLALPTRISPKCSEKFGRVLIEAMACETCVIGSNSGEIPNIIEDAGLVFNEGDKLELVGCLQRLMDDSRLREELQRRGRERVLQHFTYARFAQRAASFYHQVCAGKTLDKSEKATTELAGLSG